MNLMHVRAYRPCKQNFYQLVFPREIRLISELLTYSFIPISLTFCLRMPLNGEFVFLQCDIHLIMVPREAVLFPESPDLDSRENKANYNLRLNLLGKCDALLCLCDKDYFLPTFPLLSPLP